MSICFGSGVAFVLPAVLPEASVEEKTQLPVPSKSRAIDSPLPAFPEIDVNPVVGIVRVPPRGCPDGKATLAEVPDPGLLFVDGFSHTTPSRSVPEASKIPKNSPEFVRVIGVAPPIIEEE